MRPDYWLGCRPPAGSSKATDNYRLLHNPPTGQPAWHCSGFRTAPADSGVTVNLFRSWVRREEGAGHERMILS